MSNSMPSGATESTSRAFAQSAGILSMRCWIMSTSFGVSSYMLEPNRMLFRHSVRNSGFPSDSYILFASCCLFINFLRSTYYIFKRILLSYTFFSLKASEK